MKTQIKDDGLSQEFIGHDNRVIGLDKTYTGASYLHLSAAVPQEPNRYQHIAFHIDDIDGIIEMLQKARNR